MTTATTMFTAQGKRDSIGKEMPTTRRNIVAGTPRRHATAITPRDTVFADQAPPTKVIDMAARTGVNTAEEMLIDTVLPLVETDTARDTELAMGILYST